MNLPGVAEAAEIHGSARVFKGITDQNGIESSQLDQRYRLFLQQELTSYLRLDVDYRYNDLSSQLRNNDFGRRIHGPLFTLIYDRPGLTGRLTYEDRKARGTSPSDNFDLRALGGRLRWVPRVGPWYSVSFRNDRNVADVAIFGRDVASKWLELKADYSRPRWYARYAVRTTNVENQTVGFKLDEDRHELWAGFNQSFWTNRLAVTANTRLSRRRRTEITSDGVSPVLPVPVLQGLFAIDTTPAIGELEGRPGLIDGDTRSPVQPPIDIGGANTFRNMGVDLGMTRQVSLLEVTVDTLSDPTLIWEVYQSPDNLTWTRVAGVTSEFDSGFLRYNLRFPVTTDRFFKAVNVTVNSFATVMVTEIRPLVDVGDLESGKSLATTFRGNFVVNLRPHERVTANFQLGLRNEDDVAGGLLSRDLNEMSYNALVRFAPTSDLDLLGRYRFSSMDEKLGFVLLRDVTEWSVGLEYSPFPTVDGLLTITKRDELERDRLIASINTIRGHVLTGLLPNLSLISEIIYSLIDSPFAGFERTSWQWRETLESRLTDSVLLSGGLSVTYYDSTDIVFLTRRTRVELRAVWSATPFLSLTGELAYSADDELKTLMPRFNISWAPGPKLRVSVSYQDTDTRDLRRTTSLGAQASYRLNPKFTPFASFTRSTLQEFDLEGSTIATLRVGFNFFF
jgi:hypothetical protein